MLWPHRESNLSLRFQFPTIYFRLVVYEKFQHHLSCTGSTIRSQNVVTRKLSPYKFYVTAIIFLQCYGIDSFLEMNAASKLYVKIVYTYSIHFFFFSENFYSMVFFGDASRNSPGKLNREKIYLASIFCSIRQTKNSSKKWLFKVVWYAFGDCMM